MTRPLRLALGLFTVVPVGEVGEPDRTCLRRALLLAPLVGALIGAVTGAFVAAGGWAAALSDPEDPDVTALSSFLVAVVAVALLQVLTGGMHLDGAADTADGWAARGNRERTLAVMRDPSVGAAGACAVVLLLLVDAAALGVAMARGHGPLALVVAVVTGRLALLWAVRHPAARADGLGSWVAGTVGLPRALAWSCLWLALLVGLSYLGRDQPAPLPVLVAVPVAALVALAAVTPVRRRIGGISGDLLGAVVEVATAAALVVMALVP